MNDLENKQYERSIVERNKKDLEDDRLNQIQKKQYEKAYLKKMMDENEENKRKQIEEQNYQKELEKKDIVDYTKMLDQQEIDRLEEIKQRERKTQDLMNKVADTVLKDLDKKRKSEEDKVLQYQREKELRDRMDDDERIRRIKESQREMKEYLDRQTNEKKGKLVLEKDANTKQGEMWKKDLHMYSEEEKSIKQKIAQANKEHQDYLLRQMADPKKGKKAAMSKEEYLLNKKLLDNLEGKSKAQTPLSPPK
jgi:hypothetical protein